MSIPWHGNEQGSSTPFLNHAEAAQDPPSEYMPRLPWGLSKYINRRLANAAHLNCMWCISCPGAPTLYKEALETNRCLWLCTWDVLGLELATLH